MFPAKEEEKMQATLDNSEGCRVAGGVKGWTNPVAREASRQLGHGRVQVYNLQPGVETGDW